MFVETIKPRFCETDALGHISNTTVPKWFEGAREPIFKIFTPTMEIATWPLILARMEFDFLLQTHANEEVEVRTWISRLGGSSFDVRQELWQRGEKTVEGTSVMVFFDYETQKARPIEGVLREQVAAHCVNEADS